MKRPSTSYLKNVVTGILFLVSLSALPALGKEPCPAGTCRFLGFDDELAISAHNNSANDDENYLRTYTALGAGRYWKNDNTDKALGKRVVSSVTVTGKMTVDPLTTIKDEVFVVSIVEDNNDTRGLTNKDDRSKVNVFCLTPDSENTAHSSKTLLDLEFSAKDKTESRLGAASGNLGGDLRDELAIAYENEMGMPELLVLSNDDLNVALEARQPASLTGTTALGGGKGIVLAAGNFDGDEYDEIAMLYETHDGVQLDIYQFKLGHLSPAGSANIPHKKDDGFTWDERKLFNDCRNIAMSAGDFDGDGSDELLVATIDMTSLFLSNYEADINQAQLLLKADREELFTPEKFTFESGFADASKTTGACWDCPDLRMIAVDRDGDGIEEGIISYRTQPADYDSPYSIDAITLEPSSSNPQLSTIVTNVLENVAQADVYIRALDLSAVSFFKDGQAGKSYCYATLAKIPDSLSSIIETDYPSQSLSSFSYKVPFNGGEVSWGDQIHPSWTFSIAAGELDGEGQRLQAGDAFTIKEIYQPVLILQTPPQHIDVLEEGIANISRFVEFNSQFDYEEGASTLASNRSTAEYGNGFYTDDQLGMKYGRFSFGVKAKADAMWNDAIETQNSNYQGTALTSQLKTTVDDLVRYTSKEVVFWRYPYPSALGGENFLQFSLPDAVSESHDVPGSILEYYQPGHENGQLFSYPWFQTTQDDLEVLNSGRVMTVGQGNMQTSIALQQSRSGSTTETNGRTLKASAGIYFKAETGEEELMGPDVSLEAGFQHDHAVQQSATAETTTYGKEKITITKGGEAVELLAEQSYGIKPVFFRKEGSPIQIGYTVDPDSLGIWWDRYSAAPDVALNLPERWKRASLSASATRGEQLVGSYSYLPNEELSRYRMKGFFVADKPMSDKTAKQGWGADAGTPISLNARVYNYSMKPAVSVKVRFQYQKDDGNGWGQRHDIGTIKIAKIPAWGNSANEINWKWAEIGFTPPQTGYYCFWVIADVDDSIEELPLHDNSDSYSNNAGYWGVPFPVANTGTEPSLPPDNIAPQWMQPGKSSISVYAQERGREVDLVAENPSGPGDETLVYAAYLVGDDGSLRSLPGWIDLQQEPGSNTALLSMSPGNAMNAATLTLELQVGNAITTAAKTLRVEIVGEKNAEGATEIFHYGVHPAYYPLGMRGYTCRLETQTLEVDGEAKGDRVNSGLNRDWISLNQDSEGRWELSIIPIDPDETHNTDAIWMFWHRYTNESTQYARQQAFVICAGQASESDVPAEFHIQVANNPPKFVPEPQNGTIVRTLNGMQVQTIVLEAVDDTEETLTWSCANCDDHDFIDFDTGTHTLTIDPAQAADHEWSEDEGRLTLQASGLAVTVSDGLAEKTVSLDIIVTNELPYCEIDASITDDLIDMLDNKTFFTLESRAFDRLQEQRNLSLECRNSLQRFYATRNFSSDSELANRFRQDINQISSACPDATSNDAEDWAAILYSAANMQPGIEDNVIDELKRKIGEDFTNPNELINRLRAILGDDLTNRYQSLILEYLGLIEVTHKGSANATYSIPLANDDAGEQIFYELPDGSSSLPAWLSFDTLTGTFTMMPAKADGLAKTGRVEHRCEILLSDGGKELWQGNVSEHKISQWFHVVLTNETPSFTSPSSEAIDVARGEEWQLPLRALDADGDSLTFHASSLPDWVNARTGEYRLTASALSLMEGHRQEELEILRKQIERIRQDLDEYDSAETVQEQLESLQQQQQDYSKEIPVLETEISELEEQIQQLGGEIQGLAQDINAKLQSQYITKFQSKIAELEEQERVCRLCRNDIFAVPHSELYDVKGCEEDPPWWLARLNDGSVFYCNDTESTGRENQIQSHQKNIDDYKAKHIKPLQQTKNEKQGEKKQLQQDKQSKSTQVQTMKQLLPAIEARIQELETILQFLSSNDVRLSELENALAAEQRVLDEFVAHIAGRVLPDEVPAQTREEFAEGLETVFAQLDWDDDLREEYRIRMSEASRIPPESVLKGTPEAGDGGEHEILLTVSDDIVTTEQRLTLTVDNAPPVFTSIPLEAAALGQEYSYLITAADADGDPLRLRVQDAPDWFTSFGEETQLRSIVGSEESRELGPMDAVAPLGGTQLEVVSVPAWKVAGIPDVAGNYPVLVTVDDGSGPVEQRLTIVARDESGNAPPLFSSTPDEWIAEGREYAYLIEGDDPDGDALNLAITQGAEWLTLSKSMPEAFEIRLPNDAEGSVRKAYFLAFAPDGALYVTDTGKSIWKIPSGSREPEVFATSCGGTTFSRTYGIDVDAKGCVYVADKDNDRICRIDPAGNSTVFASGIDRPYDIALNHDGTAYVTAPFAQKLYIISNEGASPEDLDWRPFGVAVDFAGQVFVTDIAGVVRVFDPTASAWTEFAESSQAGLQSPYGITNDPGGNLYLAEYTGNQARKISRGGEISLMVSNSEHGLQAPFDVAVDAERRLYVTDTGSNARILRIEKPSWLLNGVPYNSSASDEGGQSHPVTLELSDGRVSSEQAFTIFVSSGNWVTFIKESSCSDAKGRFSIESDSFGVAECDDACPGFQVLLPPDGLLMLRYISADDCQFVACRNSLGESLLEDEGSLELRDGDEIKIYFQQP